MEPTIKYAIARHDHAEPNQGWVLQRTLYATKQEALDAVDDMMLNLAQYIMVKVLPDTEPEHTTPPTHTEATTEPRSCLDILPQIVEDAETFHGILKDHGFIRDADDLAIDYVRVALENVAATMVTMPNVGVEENR